MNRFVVASWQVVRAVALCAGAAAVGGCYGEEYTGDPAYYPSAALVASEDPVYYDGQAMYYDDGRWFYRNGGRWNYYGSEPGYLRSYRSSHPGFGRHALGGARYGGHGRSGGRGRGGGGRGGGGRR